jgi:hypothetical protein
MSLYRPHQRDLCADILLGSDRSDQRLDGDLTLLLVTILEALLYQTWRSGEFLGMWASKVFRGFAGILSLAHRQI